MFYSFAELTSKDLRFPTNTSSFLELDPAP